jgi:hypothetical protein
LYACVKVVCCLWAQPPFDTFHQVVEALWSQPVLQVRKQVVVARSEIGAVRRVVRQLTVEMHQQCLSVNNCVCRHAFSWWSTTSALYVSIPRLFVLNGPTQFFFSVLQYTLMLLWSLVAWIPPSALLSCPRKQLPSAMWQTTFFKFFVLFGECGSQKKLDAACRGMIRHAGVAQRKGHGHQG